MANLDFFKFKEFTDNFIDYSNADLTLIKMVLFAMIIVLVSFGLKKSKVFKHNKWIQLLIALCVSLLTIYFFPDRLLSFVLIPYKSLGFILINAFPFFLILFAAHRKVISSLNRRIIWLVYSFFFGFSWYNNYKAFSIIQNQIMTISAILIICAIVFDKIIYKVLKKRHKYRGKRID